MEPSRRPLIEIEHVFVTYPGTERHILNDFNLTLYEGEHAVIRGGNGAGKSTLLRLLRGGCSGMGRKGWIRRRSRVVR